MRALLDQSLPTPAHPLGEETPELRSYAPVRLWHHRLGAGQPTGIGSYALAPGLTARSALEKFAAVQMIDVPVPTTDGHELVLTRCTQPEPELQLLIQRLKPHLPPQPPPRIAAPALV